MADGDPADAPLIERVRGQRVYFDANVFIYALEGAPALRAAALPLFDLFDAGEAEAVTSEMTLAEALVLPYRTGDDVVAARYETLMAPKPGLVRVAATVVLWRAAARLRAATPSLRLPDAVHAVTAQAERCALLVTGDRRLATASPVPAALVAVPAA